MKQYIVLVMELCEYDLDHLVKVAPFKEEDIVIFLHQLGEWSSHGRHFPIEPQL